MDLFALAAAGVAAALCGVVLRGKTPELGLLLSLTACCLLLYNTLPMLQTIRDVLGELAALTELSPDILQPLVQTVALAVVTKLTAALCRDAGEGGLAALLEVAGSAAAVLTALPLLKMVLQLVMELL